MSNNPPRGSDKPEDARSEFTEFLKRPSTLQRANGVTLRTFQVMNGRMVTEGVPMTWDHFEVLSRCIENRGTVCDCMRAENSHVINSPVNGPVYERPVYNMGYAAHRVVERFNKKEK